MSPAHPDIRWTHHLPAAPVGLAPARESGHLLAWTRDAWLNLLDRHGRLLAQAHWPANVVAVAAAEDGSAFAIADRRGTVAWLTRDLKPRWQEQLADRPTALATDAFGRLLAVADRGAHLRFFDAEGRPWHEAVSPRPLHHLAFVPELPVLVAASDVALVAAFDLARREWTWKDAPVVHVGAVVASGAGRVGAACYSEGVRRYQPDGRPDGVVATPEPCRLAALSYCGRHVLTGSGSDAVHGLDWDGTLRFTHHFGQPVVALALAPLGDSAAVALADGRLLGVELEGW